MATGLTEDRLRQVFARLLDAYGPQNWWPGRSRFEIAVGAILVQNTNWTNAERAIARLAELRLLRPTALLAYDESKLREAIRPAGMYRQKARRLRHFTSWLQQYGGFDGLTDCDTTTLRASLLAVHGIGPETADCILLYVMRRPVFVVDAYTLRILDRIGLGDGGRGVGDELRALVGAGIDDVAFLDEMHALFVEHGKRTCRPRPRCPHCVLQRECEYSAADEP